VELPVLRLHQGVLLLGLLLSVLIQVYSCLLQELELPLVLERQLYLELLLLVLLPPIHFLGSLCLQWELAPRQHLEHLRELLQVSILSLPCLALEPLDPEALEQRLLLKVDGFFLSTSHSFSSSRDHLS